MQTEKREWQSIAIPKALFNKVKAIYVLCGHLSVAEYIRDKVRDAVSHDELKLQIEKERREDQ